MKPEYRGLAAIVLSTVVFVLWYTVFSPPRPPEQATSKASVTEETPAAAATAEAKKPAAAGPARKEETDPQAGFPIKTSKIETAFLDVEFSTDGGAPSAWKLKKYKRQAGDENEDVDLVPSIGGRVPMGVTFLDANFGFPVRPRFRLVNTTADEIVFRWESPEVEIIKTIKFKDNSYLADVSIELVNHSERTLTERPMLSWEGQSLPQAKTGFFGFLKQPPATNKSPVYYIDGKVKRENNTANIKQAEEKTGTLYWAGLEDRYFLSAVIPRDMSSQMAVEYGASSIESEKGGHEFFSGAALAPASIPPGAKVVHKFSVYAGPKEIGQLKAVGTRLEEAIDYGWFTVIAVPILYCLKFFHGIVKNYGIAIILLTIFIKLLLHPINVKSMRSMKQMQALQPKLKELQKKFADNKERLNMETMQLFKAHKVNPMGGCLPMLVQFPIYIALYKVLWSSIELYRAPFFWFYKDLSAPDPYLITPILLGVGMLVQQKLTPSASADPAQQKAMMLMPIMFSVFMLFLPVGLVVYILINTSMSVLQQWMYTNDISTMKLLSSFRGKIYHCGRDGAGKP